MTDVSGKFFSAKKVRTGVSPSSPGVQVGETLPPVNPPGSDLNSVGLSMPPAFVVANSPLTNNGVLQVTGAGTVAQYVRGDGTLADFPESSGGGSSVSYYLNGSVSQGTIGGVAYRELNKVPILGAGTDITINANGYIASFITDAGDPNLLEIPGGNWNFESYFSASSGGGSPSFYVELYKINAGGTATLIASSSAIPELIAFGTNITPYFSSLAVPTTVLALTDRLAVRYYVTHSGRTITLHTEGPHLCQIITTFTTGLTSLNGLNAQVQFFAVGTSGTDFNIASATATHTFNLPTASATNRGALSSGDWSMFNNKENAITAGTTAQYFRGDKTFQTLNTSVVPELTNLYYTDGRARAALSFIAGSGAYNSSTGVITIPTNNNQITNGAGYITSAALSAYLPLAGGTLTGALNGTSASFSNTLSVGNNASNQQLIIEANRGTGPSNTCIFEMRNTNATSNKVQVSFGGGTVASGYGRTFSFGVDIGGVGVKDFFVYNGGTTNTPLIITPNDRVIIGNSGISYSDLGYRLDVLGTARVTGAATFSSSVGIGVSPTAGKLHILAPTNVSYAPVIAIRDEGNPTFGFTFKLDTAVNGDLRLDAVNSGVDTPLMTFKRVTGNVGIGTASPATLLNLKSSTTTELRLESVGGTYRSFIGFRTDSQKYDLGVNLNDTTDALSINYAGTERMRITSGGNVGIGTASPGYDGAGYGAVRYTTINNASGTGSNLELATGTTANDGYVGAVDFINTSNTGASGAGRYGIASIRGFTTNASGTNTGGGYLTFNTKADGGSGAERMRITSAGNVGIGTASPSTLLNLKSSTTTELRLESVGGTYRSFIGFRTDGQKWDLGVNLNDTTDALSFNYTGTERMRITSSGNVGIGTTTDSGGKLRVKSAGNDNYAIAFERSNSTTTIGGFYQNSTSGGEMFLVASNGSQNVKISSTQFSYWAAPGVNFAIGTATDSTDKLRVAGTTFTNEIMTLLPEAESRSNINWRFGAASTASITPNRRLRVKVGGVEYYIGAVEV
jgi:hypothetical protein